MDLINIALTIGGTVLTWIAIAVCFVFLVFLILVAYNMLQHVRLMKAKQKTEDAMLDILAEFDAAIDSCSADDQKETLDRFTKLRAEFEQVMAKYYDDPNNNQSVH
ncbi:hypothetical protein KAR91_86495 [Candidatus Pacearchaeota archaeon]|nr:hypothetical protein [Candidatus Pacearchaeota archaeon]